MTITSKIFQSYLWNMLGKIAMRGLGIISTLVLVRLLSPEDFGLVALAAVVVGFLEVLTEFGADRYLVLKDNVTTKDIHVAWSSNFLLRGSALFLLCLLAPIIAEFLDKEEAAAAIQLIALSHSVGLLGSMKTVMYQKQLNFKVINGLQVGSKVVSFVITMIAAFWLQNYIALVIGTLSNVLTGVVLGHIVAPYKPKLVFDFKGEMFRFSKFLMLRNIVGYTRSQADFFFVGRLYGFDMLGQYRVAQQFAIMPQTEFIRPSIKPLLAGFSSIKSDSTYLHSKLYQLMFLCWSFVIPCAVGLRFISSDFTLVILGEQWKHVDPIIRNLGFLMLPFITQPFLYTIYDLQGKTKLSIYNDIFALVALLTVVLTLLPGNAVEFSVMRMEVALLVLFSMLIIAKINLGLSIKNFTTIIVMIVPPTMVMAFVLFMFVPYLAELEPAVRLPIIIISGAVVYLTICLLELYMIAKYAKDSFTYNLYPNFIISHLSKHLKMTR